MVKYLNAFVVFEEIPDEITLAINITNCPHRCEGCHSPELRMDIGEELTDSEIDHLIDENGGITCVCFMGEGNDLDGIFNIGRHIQNKYGLKVAIYAGSKFVPKKFWGFFDYIKVGGYDKDLGPINVRTTNQRMYKRNGTVDAADGVPAIKWDDITDKFWKRETGD